MVIFDHEQYMIFEKPFRIKHYSDEKKIYYVWIKMCCSKIAPEETEGSAIIIMMIIIKIYIKICYFFITFNLRATLCCVMHKILEKMWDASILEVYMICKYTEKQWKGSTIKCKNMFFVKSPLCCFLTLFDCSVQTRTWLYYVSVYYTFVSK